MDANLPSVERTVMAPGPRRPSRRNARGLVGLPPRVGSVEGGGEAYPAGPAGAPTTGDAVGPVDLERRWWTLPAPVQRYLRFAIPPDAPALRRVRMRHGGWLRPDPVGPWRSVRGEEELAVGEPGFRWRARVQLAPLFWVDVRDELRGGHGRMVAKLESLRVVADAAGPELDQGERMRWLAELPLAPFGAIAERVHWRPLDAHRAAATLLVRGLPASVVYEFDDEGRALRVSGPRYRSLPSHGFALTEWAGSFDSYRTFDGFRVPTRLEVGWQLDEGWSPYVRFEVDTVSFDPPEDAPPPEAHGASGTTPEGTGP